MGGDKYRPHAGKLIRYFNPRLPGGRRLRGHATAAMMKNFNPRLPGGRRQGRTQRPAAPLYFNPRLPGGRRRQQGQVPRQALYFNPRLPGGRRHHAAANTYRKIFISIHASRVGGDVPAWSGIKPEENFNPRLPGGRRPDIIAAYDAPAQFQSTPPGWEATRLVPQKNKEKQISIHASRVGGDAKGDFALPPVYTFQSTPPGWEATGRWHMLSIHSHISIHASRVGGDYGLSDLRDQASAFQSTPPGWEATSWSMPSSWTKSIFQSTPPGWEATAGEGNAIQQAVISIHASRVGGDRRHIRVGEHKHQFQSTPPGWEATGAGYIKLWRSLLFQSTPPGWEATQRCLRRAQASLNFNPRLPGGRRRIVFSLEHLGAYFNPRLPGGRRPEPLRGSAALREFQSTPPGWEATYPAFCFIGWFFKFQSTPPGWEATREDHPRAGQRHDFNPRLPGGRRRSAWTTGARAGTFQSTPPGWEATGGYGGAAGSGKISIHASRVGGDIPQKPL